MGELEIFALRLKQMREKMQMTQKEFSAFLGVKQQTLSGYERGTAKPPLDIAKNISKKCNVSLDWLCGLSDRENPDEKVKKYSNIVALLLKLNTGIGIGLKTIESNDAYKCNSSVLTIEDDILFDFINEWDKMRALKSATTIDNDVFALWIEKTLLKYNLPIDNDHFEKREKRFLEYKKKKYPLLY